MSPYKWTVVQRGREAPPRVCANAEREQTESEAESPASRKIETEGLETPLTIK